MEKRYDATVRVHAQEGYIKDLTPKTHDRLVKKWNEAKNDSDIVVNLWTFPLNVRIVDSRGEDTAPIYSFDFLHSEDIQFVDEIKKSIKNYAAKGLDLDFENEIHFMDAQHHDSLFSAERAAHEIATLLKARGADKIRVEGTVLPALVDSPNSLGDIEDSSCVKKMANILASHGFNVEIDLSRTYDNAKNDHGPEKTIKVE